MYELYVLWKQGTWTYYGPYDKDALKKRLDDLTDFHSYTSFEVREVRY